jgi:hypothetical protein
MGDLSFFGSDGSDRSELPAWRAPTRTLAGRPGPRASSTQAGLSPAPAGAGATQMTTRASKRGRLPREPLPLQQRVVQEAEKMPLAGYARKVEGVPRE